MPHQRTGATDKRECGWRTCSRSDNNGHYFCTGGLVNGDDKEKTSGSSEEK